VGINTILWTPPHYQRNADADYHHGLRRSKEMNTDKDDDGCFWNQVDVPIGMMHPIHDMHITHVLPCCFFMVTIIDNFNQHLIFRKLIATS